MQFRKGIILLFIAALMIQTGCAQETPKTEVTTLAETTSSWNGDVLPAYPKGQPKVTVLKFVIPPKTRLPDHYHTVINSGYVIKGELTVVDVNNEVLYLKEGDVIVELVNKIHHGVNNGDVPVELVVFYAGTTDLPITVLADPNAKGH
ncbi:MAG: hypothetical protein RLZZ241_256 [Bacteroidota bacterium]|jgi:quercetin dioxygenase-like cupin family protein